MERHGYDTSRSALSVRARLRRHRDCGAVTIAGLDAPRCGLEVWADPVPLTAAGELAVLLAGRATFDLQTVAGAPCLIWRDAFRVTDRRWPVLGAHACPGVLRSWPVTRRPAPNNVEASSIPF